jgi:hypothetical protein
MTTMRFDDLRQYSDVVRARSGEAVTVRFVEPRDAEALQSYFRSLTTRSRYNRFLGAASELPPSLLDQFIHIGEADRFSVVATHRVRPVDRRSLARPWDRQGAAEKSRMPRGLVRRRSPVRRHAAFQ